MTDIGPLFLTALVGAAGWLAARHFDGSAAKLSDLDSRVRGLETGAAAAGVHKDSLTREIEALRTEVHELRSVIADLRVFLARHTLGGES